MLVTGYFWHENRNRAYTTRLSAYTGDPVWERITQGTGEVSAYAITNEYESGSTFITGSFRGTIDFDPTEGIDLHTAPGNLAIFVSKYQTAAGAYEWTYAVGSTQSQPGACDCGDGIHVAANGDIYVNGTFSGPLDFDPINPGGELTNGSMYQTMFVLVLDSDAHYRWAGAMSAPGAGAIMTRGAALVGRSLYVCGSYGGIDIDLDPTTGVDLHSSTVGPLGPTWDPFVIKLNED